MTQSSVSQAELRVLMAQQRKQMEPAPAPVKKQKKKREVKLPADFFSNQRHKRKNVIEMGPSKPKSKSQTVDTTGEPPQKKQRLDTGPVTEITTEIQNASDDFITPEEDENEELDLKIEPVTMNKFEQNRTLSRFAKESAEREETAEIEEQIAIYEKIEELKKKTQELRAKQPEAPKPKEKSKEETEPDEDIDDEDMDALMGWGTKKKSKK